MTQRPEALAVPPAAATPISADAPAPRAAHPTLRGHLEIARFDHWVKNVFVLPGILVAQGVEHLPWDLRLVVRIIVGLLATGLIASSNYILNELMDAPYDRQHPSKSGRPVPSGRVSIPLAYAQWLLFMAVGMALAFFISLPFALSLAALWIMGIIYNVPPVRSKDVPYIDVLSESINNPLRMLAGWYIIGPLSASAPASLLMSYWMVGCYFMAVKRFAEYRMIASPARAASYRRSFAHYNEERLLVSIMFYAAAAMLFFGAFIMRYRLELVLSFPFVALVMSIYLAIAFKDDSAVQAPEKLYREPWLMTSVLACTVVMVALLAIDLPSLRHRLDPRAPTPITAPRKIRRRAANPAPPLGKDGTR